MKNSPKGDTVKEAASYRTMPLTKDMEVFLKALKTQQRDDKKLCGNSYRSSLVENGKTAKEKGISAFLEQDRQKWTCLKCGGAFSLHDGVCSECGNNGHKK